MLTVNETVKECRQAARDSGLVFIRKDKNNYYFKDRKTGIQVTPFWNLGNSYNNVCSGYIATYDSSTQLFKGLNL